MVKDEIHLFIIWNKAFYKRDKILEDIKKRFQILDIYNVQWSLDKFSENLSRFYGENLPKNSHKEKHCGTGVFTCVVVRDNAPVYDMRLTSKGYKIVNTNLFDAKKLYREWTGGGHRIHATDNINESKLQLLLLFGLKYEYYKNKNNSYKEIDYKNDLIGANGWNSFEELFDILNYSVKYVILRNFENLDEQLTSKHPDVDLLVENRKLAADILNAKPTTKKSFRTQYVVKVKGRDINFDLRYLGDNYYDLKFQQDILNNRKKYKYFYVPDDELLLYSLIYHALIHKTFISPDYINVFEKLFQKLNINYDRSIFVETNLLDFLIDFMYKKGYSFVEPYDLTVGFNTRLINQRIFIEKSLKRKLFEKYIDLRSKPKRLAKKILKKLNIK